MDKAKKERRGNGEGTIHFNTQRGCYEVRVSYLDELGKQKRKRFTAKTKKLALEKAKEWQNSISGGLLPNKEKITLEEWINEYLKLYAKNRVAIKTFQKYESCFKCYVIPNIGKIPLQKVTNMQIQYLLNELLETGGEKKTGISSYTVSAVRRYLILVFEQAVKNGLVMKNVIKDTSSIRISKKEILPLTPKQVKRLLKIAKEFGEVTYIVISIALNTGMRLGEIFGLKWDCVDFENNLIFVKRSLVTSQAKTIFSEPKTQRSKRKILISERVKNDLHEYKEWQEKYKVQLRNKYIENNLVVINMFGKVMNTSNFTSRIFKPMLKKADIDTSFKFHDLRHTHATMLLLANINPKIVSERLGHSTVAMTLNTYSHLLPDMQNMAVEALEKMLD